MALLDNPPSLPTNVPSITRPQNYNVTSGAGRRGLAIPRIAGVGLPSIFGSVVQNSTDAAPILAQSNLNNLLNYGPSLAAAETATSRAGQLGQARTSADVLAGPGQDVARGVRAAGEILDPEYYSSRARLGSGIQSLLGGLNPNDLSGSEEANIERNANRSNIGQGTANTGSNTAAIKNALLFGDRLQQKQNQISTILSQVGGALPALKTSDANFANLTGAAGAGAGSGILDTTTQSLGTASTLGSNLLGQSGTLINTGYGIDKSRPPLWQQVVGSLPDYS